MVRTINRVLVVYSPASISLTALPQAMGGEEETVGVGPTDVGMLIRPQVVKMFRRTSWGCCRGCSNSEDWW